MNRIKALDAQRPQWERYIEDVAVKMGASAFCLNIFTEDFRKGLDSLIQFSVAIMLDKPIYLMAPEGTKIPSNVRLVAKGIEFYKPGDQESMSAAAKRLMLLATGQSFPA